MRVVHKMVKIILKKNEMEELALLNVKTFYKTRVIKTVWFSSRDRQIYQQNMAESLILDRLTEVALKGP